jgi:hypothetical protein
LIDLLLLLRGCIIGGVSSHVGIGGEFCHFWIFLKNYHYFFNFLILQKVLFENVENLAPSHFVDVFDGNDVPVNGVLWNVGHEAFATHKDPLDGALTQIYLMVFFLVLCHMLLLLTLSLHKKFRFLLILLF